jgi:protein-disulfide isomerase
MTSSSASRRSRDQKVAEQRRLAQRAESRRHNLIRGAVAGAVLLLVVGVGLLVQTQRGTDASGRPPGGSTGTASQSISVGPATAAVSVVVYEDFQCPVCKRFEEQSGPYLRSLVDDGKIRLEYRPIAFLDKASSTAYSTRALNATGCVIDRSPGSFQKFHDLLFAAQPAEGSAGLPDSRLLALAAEAGAGDLGRCVPDRSFAAWVKGVTDQASKDNVVGTPTILVGGRVLPSFDQPTVAKAVDAALAKP